MSLCSLDQYLFQSLSSCFLALIIIHFSQSLNSYYLLKNIIWKHLIVN